MTHWGPHNVLPSQPHKLVTFNFFQPVGQYSQIGLVPQMEQDIFCGFSPSLRIAAVMAQWFMCWTVTQLTGVWGPWSPMSHWWHQGGHWARISLVHQIIPTLHMCMSEPLLRGSAQPSKAFQPVDKWDKSTEAVFIILWDVNEMCLSFE